MWDHCVMCIYNVVIALKTGLNIQNYFFRMPLSSAEKLRRYRAKKKQTDPDFQKKENLRIEARRKKKSPRCPTQRKKDTTSQPS